MANNVGSIGNLPGTSQPAGATIPQHVLLVDTNGSPVVIAGSTVATAAGIQYQTGTSTNAPTGNVIMALAGGSSVVAVEGSTLAAPAGGLGLFTRPILPSLQSTSVVVNSSNSTALYALVSSVASKAIKVFAYIIGSTVTQASTLVFQSSNGSADRWAVMLGSGSSGVTGANLAIAPPAWIFQTNAGEALNVRFESASTGQLTRIALSWFVEP